MERRKKRLPLRAVLAANVRRHRTLLNVTQERLAELCGLHRTYVSQVERAQNNVTLETLEAFADVLGVEPHELLAPQEVRAEGP